jgi:hypothetical protein
MYRNIYRVYLRKGGDEKRRVFEELSSNNEKRNPIHSVQGEIMKKQITWLVLGLLLASFIAGCAPAAAPAPQVIKETVVVKETVPAVKETVLVPAPTTDPAVAADASPAPVSLMVYNPTGALAVKQLFSARLSDLNGKTICEMGESWESQRTFPLISSLLQKQFPTVVIVDDTKTPNWTATPDQKLVDQIKALGCQGVIIGNAG